MRIVSPLLVLFTFALVGCGPQMSRTPSSGKPSQAKPTRDSLSNDTRTSQSVGNYTGQPKPPKHVEEVKPSDPWEEARAYFKKVKEGEKEATAAKLKKLDKTAEGKIGFYVGRCRDDLSTLAAGKYPSSIGEELLAAGFTELVESQSAWALDDEKFRSVFKRLNPQPSAKEIINATVRFATTHDGLRAGTLRIIESNGDTRDDADIHRTATAWTGK